MTQDRHDSEVTSYLLEEAAKGDLQATNDLMMRHQDWVRRVIENRLDPRLRSRVDSWDLTHEVYALVARRFTAYLSQSPRRPFRSWLWMLAHDQAIQAWRRHLKAQRRSIKLEQPMDRLSEESIGAASDPTPSQVEIKREMEEILRSLFHRLSEDDRVILDLVYFQKLSHREAAEQMGIGLEAAHKRHQRALQRFGLIVRERLSKELS